MSNGGRSYNGLPFTRDKLVYCFWGKMFKEIIDQYY
jgi:hypothetical protein